jgi:hypothetical protein
VWPRFIQAQRTTLKPASDRELCRRVALDFTGMIPTPEEYESKCKGKTPLEIARGFINSPRLAEVEEREWAQHLSVDPMKLAALYYVDAGLLVKKLARGELGYDDFAAKMIAHPAIAIHRPVDGGTLQDSAAHAIRMFLGRSPAPGEVDDFANLLRPWKRNYVPAYKEGYGYYVRKATLVADACNDPVLGTARCTSRLFGAVTTIELPTTMADSSKCGIDGESGDLQGLCYDLILGKVPDEIQKELEKAGRLLATRRSFGRRPPIARSTGCSAGGSRAPMSPIPSSPRCAPHSRHGFARRSRTTFASCTSPSRRRSSTRRPPTSVSSPRRRSLPG